MKIAPYPCRECHSRPPGVTGDFGIYHSPRCTRITGKKCQHDCCPSWKCILTGMQRSNSLAIDVIRMRFGYPLRVLVKFEFTCRGCGEMTSTRHRHNE